MDRPDLLLLDVNETLSDLEPMAGVFAGLGLEEHQARLWFAQVLRDGIAVAATGRPASFADIGRATAATMLRAADLDPGGADRVVETFTSLDVHPDVRDGLPRLSGAGVRVVTLSNGSAAVARGLLERAGLADAVEASLGADDTGVWKPAPRAYHVALERCGVAPGAAALAAVHPWDVHGAIAAGLGGVLVDRAGLGAPAYLEQPTLVVRGFDELADRWA